ncbi:MAG TPA: OmpA family protein [Polyangiales bacterium]
MKDIMLTSALGVCSLLTAGGCAHTPPEELLDARSAYQQAASGAAREHDPAQLHEAEKLLAAAEASYREDGDSARTRDFAYIAQRKAQIADVAARTALSEQQLAALEQQASATQTAELARLRGDYQSTQQQLASEQAARQQAEQRAEQASADLARIATVKQEERGTVITLSGEVLFVSGKADLLPSARAKLTEVATALTQNHPDAAIVVEGHTDSQGSAALNLDLSQRRAQAVGDFLASHGVARERIRAEGLGFSKPVTDNKTAAGRANNRRVEIVVQPSAAETDPSKQPAPAQPSRQPG